MEGKKEKRKKEKEKGLLRPFHNKNEFYFNNCSQENRWVKKAFKAHKKKFKTKKKHTIKKCIEKCKKDKCLLRKHIDENKLVIFYNDTRFCESLYCPKHEVPRTYCLECNLDLGEWGFTRQLCGKYYCEKMFNKYE